MKLPSAALTRTGLAEQAAGWLRREILSGRIPTGERLPGERELAAHLGTNRNTLREAIRDLEARGLVTVRHGEGVTVADFRQEGALEVLGPFLAEGPEEERPAILADLLRVRRALLVDMAAMAAERADEAGVARLRECLGAVRAAGDDPPAALAADFEFFRALAAASGSLVARWGFNTVARAYLDMMRAVPELWVRPAGYERTLEALTAAVAAHDAVAAQRILSRHLADVDRALGPVGPQQPRKAGARGGGRRGARR